MQSFRPTRVPYRLTLPPANRLSLPLADQPTVSRADGDPAAEFRLLSRPEPGREWRPWEVEPPWTDRRDIQWPGGEWPPLNQPIVVEEVCPEELPQIIISRDAGGLLDMWA